jgi:hypothetical protein
VLAWKTVLLRRGVRLYRLKHRTQCDMTLQLDRCSATMCIVGLLVAVSRRLVRTGLLDSDVLRLVVGEDGQLRAELVQVETSDLLIEVLRENVHLEHEEQQTGQAKRDCQHDASGGQLREFIAARLHSLEKIDPHNKTAVSVCSNLVLILLGSLLVPELELRDDLVGERARHDERRVTGGAAQVQETTLSEDDHTVTLREDKLVDLRLDVDALDAGEPQNSGHVDLLNN